MLRPGSCGATTTQQPGTPGVPGVPVACSSAPDDTPIWTRVPIVAPRSSLRAECWEMRHASRTLTSIGQMAAPKIQEKARICSGSGTGSDPSPRQPASGLKFLEPGRYVSTKSKRLRKSTHPTASGQPRFVAKAWHIPQLLRYLPQP